MTDAILHLGSAVHRIGHRFAIHPELGEMGTLLYLLVPAGLFLIVPIGLVLPRQRRTRPPGLSVVAPHTPEYGSEEASSK